MIRKQELVSEETTESSGSAQPSNERSMARKSSTGDGRRRGFSFRHHLRKDCNRMMENVSRRAFPRNARVYTFQPQPRRDKKHKDITATVVYLDDTAHKFSVDKKVLGQVLLDEAFEFIDLIEKDYFGLQYKEDENTSDDSSSNLIRWLDPHKPLKKQTQSQCPVFQLGIRFFPPEPCKLGEEYTRHLLYLQIRKLLLERRLQAPVKTARLLASFTVQAELGDFDPDVHTEGYLSELELLPEQSAEDEDNISFLHKMHRQQSPADAETNFLQLASKLDKYGMELYPAQDYKGKDVMIGISWCGIVVFRNDVRINTFSWPKIVKTAYKDKRFFIQINKEPCEDYNTHLGFNTASARAAKRLCRASVEFFAFYRFGKPRARGPGAFLGALGALAGLARPAPSEARAAEAARRAQATNRVFVRKSSVRGSLMRECARVPGQQLAPRVAWAGNTRPAPAPAPAPPPLPAPLTISEDKGNLLERRICDTPLPYVDDTSSDDSEEGALVRLQAGADGLFGFNVRGGDGAHVLVAKVASDTPAHECMREGDRVLSINGIEVDNLKYPEIVRIIKNVRGTLELKIKRNAIREESATEEPASVFVPLATGARADDPLAQSLLLLGDGLASGAALLQYETLQRRLPDESCAVARKTKNLHLNRYRDIVPYDKSRVILKKGPNGDYINASYINMEIPPSNLTLSYIASQGPLPYTTGDFWQMVWECETTLVVMLTVLTENDRAKCHQYWPNLNQPSLKVTKDLSVSTVSETNAGHYIHREMVLMKGTNQSRNINHLQYVSWPDHGVPQDQQAFLQFTALCNEMRTRLPPMPVPVAELQASPAAADPPMLVHCSAGVGRTGALVLAESALELMRRAQPVYPLDLVRHMRRQRPMCIQNSSQYKFVCESILTAYSSGFAQTEEK